MRIGIDPGISGAMALLDDNLCWLQISSMPTMTMGKRQVVNAAELAKQIKSWDNVFPKLTVYLERVSAMPGQGVSGMFNFGVSYGIIQGIVGALQIPLVLVSPTIWKKRAGLIGKPKDAARALAKQLYPNAPLGLKKDIGKADALLIARFGI